MNPGFPFFHSRYLSTRPYADPLVLRSGGKARPDHLAFNSKKILVLDSECDRGTIAVKELGGRNKPKTGAVKKNLLWEFFSYEQFIRGDNRSVGSTSQ
jgi:hypothetical protein